MLEIIYPMDNQPQRQLTQETNSHGDYWLQRQQTLGAIDKQRQITAMISVFKSRRPIMKTGNTAAVGKTLRQETMKKNHTKNNQHLKQSIMETINPKDNQPWRQ